MRPLPTAGLIAALLASPLPALAQSFCYGLLGDIEVCIPEDWEVTAAPVDGSGVEAEAAGLTITYAVTELRADLRDTSQDRLRAMLDLHFQGIWELDADAFSHDLVAVDGSAGHRSVFTGFSGRQVTVADTLVKAGPYLVSIITTEDAGTFTDLHRAGHLAALRALSWGDG